LNQLICMHITNSMEFQSLQNKQNNRTFSKKKYGTGQICPDWAEAAQIQPRCSKKGGAVAAFEPARGPGWSAARGCRIGTGPARSSDQVAIDGRRSSSTRKRAGAAETLGFCLGVAGAHRGAAGRWGRVGGGCGGS
jgi:hypothetical protein